MAVGSRRGWRRACVAFLISFAFAWVLQPATATASGKRAASGADSPAPKKSASAGKSARKAPSRSTRKKAARPNVKSRPAGASGAKRAKALADARARNDELLGRLGKHKQGKSCLYINKLADVDLRVLESLVSESWEAARAVHGEPA